MRLLCICSLVLLFLSVNSGFEVSSCVECPTSHHCISTSRASFECLCPPSTIGSSSCQELNPCHLHPCGDFPNRCDLLSAGTYECACATEFYSAPDGSECYECSVCESGSFVIKDCLEFGNRECSECGMGSYTNSTNMENCIVCSPGFWTDEHPPYVSCTNPCEKGFFCKNQTKTACPMGTFSEVGLSDCIVCPSGEYQPSVQSTSCHLCCEHCVTTGESADYHDSIDDCLCKPGYYGSSGDCTACAAGRFAVGPGATLCAECGAGYYSGEAATVCRNCLAGFECPGSGGGENICSQGHFALAGSSACRVCPDDTYASAPGTDSCTSCPEYSRIREPNSSMHDSLSDCQCTEGYASSIKEDGGMSCVPCAAGKMKGTAGNEGRCVNCPSGTWSNPGSAECLLECPAGSICRGDGTISECPAGSFAPANSFMCTICLTGEYNPSSNQAACLSCPSGSKAFGSLLSSHDELSDCLCSEDGYVLNVTTLVCDPCPAGFYCVGGLQHSCADGEMSEAGQFRCTQCAAGTHSTPSHDGCPTCDTGYYSSAHSSSCIPCLIGGTTCNSASPDDHDSWDDCFCNARHFYSETLGCVAGYRVFYTKDAYQGDFNANVPDLCDQLGEESVHVSVEWKPFVFRQTTPYYHELEGTVTLYNLNDEPVFRFEGIGGDMEADLTNRAKLTYPNRSTVDYKTPGVSFWWTGFVSSGLDRDCLGWEKLIPKATVGNYISQDLTSTLAALVDDCIKTFHVMCMESGDVRREESCFS
eukprot:GCRY01003454.1.p1 GENE.GCRY01003454.1~~GCRY01003454.1.p1  ORF type:complete len:760 (+),score=76.75 GCRY01003454.1:177-2456(+)